jgi:PAS domain S-box-containing protein
MGRGCVCGGTADIEPGTESGLKDAETLRLRSRSSRIVRPEEFIQPLPAMNNEQWKLWHKPRLTVSESPLLRYGVAVVLPLVAAYLIHLRQTFTEVPYFAFLAAIVLSAANSGLAPAYVSTALSLLLLRLFFVGEPGSLYLAGQHADMERMAGFVLVAVAISSFVATLRRQRDQFRDSEERYRLLADSASDAIFVIDEEGVILYVNPVGEKIFNTSASKMLGGNLDDLLPANGYRAQLQEMKDHLDTRKPAVAVQLPCRKEGSEHLLIEMTMGTSSHRGKNLFTAIIRDITKFSR